jgi:aryl-alcohol dehydrogenase-like predicted oxidoreductase
VNWTRRELLHFLKPAVMAATFLPIAGRNGLWLHAAAQRLAMRPLGRTGREVTTFGLAGGNKVMWDLPGDEGVEIIVKAIRSGITYLETANNYISSQRNYNRAFRILNLIPNQPGYDPALRTRLFLASKTQLRYAVIRDNTPQRGVSAWGGRTSVEDLLHSLTTIFGDGKGSIPDGAYIDLMQIHSLRREEDVDAVFEGLETPSDRTLPRIGTLAALIDFRDGSNLTGLNPGNRRYIRHIGITGHENPTAHMYALRRDTRGDLETLLVAVNPNDRYAFSHINNSIPVAAAKGMGIIGMKVFADGVMYGLPRTFASRPGQSVTTVGQPGKVPPADLLRYALSVPGVSTLIAGIGLIDASGDPGRDQLLHDLMACQQTDLLWPEQRADIEVRVEQLHGKDTNFYQRPSDGLVPPQKVAVERIRPDGPAKISWATAYAGPDPILRYEIFRREERIASVPFQPQISEAPFTYEDTAAPANNPGGIYYKVRAVDTAGRTADALSVKL